MSKRTVSWMRMKQRMSTDKIPGHRHSEASDISTLKEAKAVRVTSTGSGEKAKPEKLNR